MPSKNLNKLKLEFLARFDIEPIVEFRDAVSRATAARLKALTKATSRKAIKFQGKNVASSIVASYFGDEVALAESVSDLAEALAIVALFGALEIRYKKMCVVAIPGISDADLFKWKDFGKTLAKAGVKLETLNGYTEVNQLRCLNNSIKHEQKVGKELAATGWGAKGDPIDANQCASEFQCFALQCDDFLQDLSNSFVRVNGW